MQCPKCGNELRISKDGEYGLCNTCRKKFKLASLEKYYDTHAQKEAPASSKSADGIPKKAPAKKAPGTASSQAAGKVPAAKKAAPEKGTAKKSTSNQGTPGKTSANRTKAPAKKKPVGKSDRKSSARPSRPSRPSAPSAERRPKSAKAKFILPRTLIGAFSILIGLFVVAQVFVPFMAHLISSGNEINKTIGLAVAICMILGGLIALIFKNKSMSIGFIIPGILFLAGAVIGMLKYGTYTDLRFFSLASGIFGALMMLFLFLQARMNVLIAILVPFVLVAVVGALFWMKKPASSKTGSGSSTQASDDGSTAETPKNAVEAIDFSTDNFTVKYTKNEIGTNYEGKDCLLVYYEFTNNTKDTLTASSSVVLTAAQNGTNCETAITEQTNTEEDNYSKDVKAGKTVSVCQAFTITDKSEVTLTINDMASLDGESQSQVLTLK